MLVMMLMMMPLVANDNSHVTSLMQIGWTNNLCTVGVDDTKQSGKEGWWLSNNFSFSFSFCRYNYN